MDIFQWQLAAVNTSKLPGESAVRQLLQDLAGYVLDRGNLSRLQLAAVNTSEVLGSCGVGQPTASPEVYVLGKGWTLCTYSWQL